MKSLIYLYIAALVLAVSGCKEEDRIHPYGSDDGTAPGKVSVISYVPIAGGATITYQGPTNSDLMYIKAKYTLMSGKQMEARASVYSDKITIEGFGDTEPKDIVFSAVDRMENEGEATSFQIVPGEPSLLTAYKTLEMENTFGGVFISMKNENRGNLIVEVQTTDSLNRWHTIHTEYTATDLISFALRGYDTTPRTFAVSVRDPWENTTDTAFRIIHPLYEKELDRGKFRAMTLPGDRSVAEWGFTMEQLWSGKNKWGDWNMIHSLEDPKLPWPAWFTFDLGVVAKLSRIKYWQRLGDDMIYQHGNPKKWEMWGTAETPNASGSFDGWTLLMECESIKPSGWPPRTNSAEDKERATNGEEFVFPNEAPPVRYIRMKVIETWSGAEFINFQQMWFWGREE